MSHEPIAGVALDALFADAARVGAARGAVVAGCTSDWRQVRPGDAFVAVLTDDDDGHDHAERAVKRGAVAVIADRPVPVFSTPVYLVEDSRAAFGTLCHALADNPSQRLRVIGVIGDQGKSTVIALLESIFAAAEWEVGVISSLKCCDGMSTGPGVSAALSPTELAARIARMEAAGCDVALVEISSQALAQAKLAGLELHAVCGTTVDAAALDLHATKQNYRDALRRVFDHLSADGIAVLCADDAVSCRWLSTLDAPSLTYGHGEQAQITSDVVERNANETIFVLNAGAESAAVRTALVGDHQVLNCLAAAAVALADGIDLQTIAAGLEQLQRLPARMERVDCGQDFAVFVDAAASATALRAALRTARQLARGRVVCVLGDAPAGSARDATTIRRLVEKLADVAIVTDGSATHQGGWSKAATDAGPDVHIVADRGEAIAWAVAIANPGDVVVIAGSRGSNEFAFGSATISDAEATRELLYARARPALRLVA